MISILGESFFLILGVLVIVATVKSLISSSNQKTYGNMRCPSYGAPARIHGNTWECSECRDFGRYGSK